MNAIRALLIAFVFVNPALAGVVINEIMYHAPEDLEGVQFIELHNLGEAPVDISNWRITKGLRHQFPAGTSIPADGYLVICKDAKLFQKYYEFEAAGVFAGSLNRNGDQLELRDAKDQVVDTIRYKAGAPWPSSADGCSSSLERICPNSPGDSSDNWAASPPAKGPPKPNGTPGKKNSVYSKQLPPTINQVSVQPIHVAPNEPITISANISQDAVSVELIYRIASSNSESDDVKLAMFTRNGEKFTATIPGQPADRIVRVQIRAVNSSGGERLYPHPNELRPALSVWVHEPYKPGKIPLGMIVNVGRREFRTNHQVMGRNWGPPSPPPPARSNSAFVYVNQATGEPKLFDFVTITPRNGGHKVHFHKDRALDGMTTINIIFEGSERFLLAETMAYEVYRQAGNGACRTDFIRMWDDGKALGYHLLIEQPNKSFLRRQKLRTDGNLYKCVWFGRSLVGQHEKKTHPHDGHDDLKQIVDELNKTKGDEQWEVIKKNFDVEQFINYFAVNMAISNWDGYFNNYFTYHNVRGNGKWTIYPWDEDKTWGFHDGIQGYEVFTDMPITFGMAGDVPPGHPRDRPPPGFFGAGAIWWRPGGYFSKPLLANPQFRRLFLARTKEVLEKVYTEEVFFPRIQILGERLEEEVRIRAKCHGENPDQASEHLKRNLDSLREHLTKRRKWLLEQDEIKSAGAFDRTILRN